MAKGEKRFFGDPAPIQQNYLVNDFINESPTYKPVKSVHIQVGVDEADIYKESAWVEQQTPLPNAVVAYCDLSAKNAQQQIEKQQAFHKVRGIRQIVGRHIDEDKKHDSNALLSNSHWLKGLKHLADKGLSFDLQMIPPQIDEVYLALSKVEQLNVALCHCGSPWDQSPEGIKQWRKGLEKLAQLPNFYCKISGLGMFNHQWQEADLLPIIHACIDIFGPERIMFGSNFPVDKLYRSYDSYWRCYEHSISGFSSDEQNKMLHDNAKTFYQII